MAFKLVAAFVLIAIVSGDLVDHDPRLVYSGEHFLPRFEPFNPHPQYAYAYGVHDALSGDSKGLVETRDGDVVRGEYSVVDADGFKRTVKYTADDVNGFKAIVDRTPLPKEENTAPLEVKTHIVAPISAPIVAPIPAPITTPLSLGNIAPLRYTAPHLVGGAAHVYSGSPLIKSLPYNTHYLYNPSLAYTASTPIIRSVPFTNGNIDPALFKGANNVSRPIIIGDDKPLESGEKL